MSEATDQHELICKLKDLAIDLGRTPTRDEFYKHIKQRKPIDKFGGYTVLVQAAGLDPVQRKKKALTNEIFEQSVERHLEDFKPAKRILLEPYPTMAIISDIHWPFHSQRVIDRFYRWVDDHKPSVVILDGDAWDMYSHAKFPRSHNQFTPKAEEDLARGMNIAFWLEIQRKAPKAKCYQMLGNHDVRPLKRTLEVLPSMEHWIAKIFGELFTFDGVETILDPRKELMFGDIMVHHGYKSQLGEHRDHSLFNAIVGHTHRAGVVFREIRGQTLWEMNCGYAGDPLAKGLTYTPQRITGWTPGFGAVDPDGPRVIIS